MINGTITVTTNSQNQLGSTATPAGAAGIGAYQTALLAGFVGSQTAWLASLIGPQGAAGSSGPPGPTGATGATGAPGAPGVIRTLLNDAGYAVLPTDRLVAYIAISAARIITLPAASAYPTGVRLLIVDESGFCSAVNTLTVIRAGTDTINGTTGVVLSNAYAYLSLESNGANKWTLVDQSTLSMAQQAASNVAVTGGTIDGTAIGGTTPAAATVTTLQTAGSIGIGTAPAVGDPSLGIKSTFLQNWRISSSNSNGNFYFFDVTNTKFPITVEPNTPSNTFYVKGSGNVGLGTATPSQTLSLYASYPQVSFYATTSGRATSIGYSDGYNFFINASAGYVLLNSTGGFVGIGTATPACTLDVVGLIRPGQYTVGTLPSPLVAAIAYAGNGRMYNGAGTLEGVGSGTGGLVTSNGTVWRIAGTNITVSA